MRFAASTLILVACSSPATSQRPVPETAPVKAVDPEGEPAGEEPEASWEETCAALGEHLEANPRLSFMPMKSDEVEAWCGGAKGEHEKEAFRCRLAATSSKSFEACEEELRRKSPEHEARWLLAVLLDGTVARTQEEAQGGSTQCVGDVAGPPSQSTTLPPMQTACHEAPDGRCVATDSPTETFEYDAALWESDPLFRAIEFRPTEPTFMHYRLEVGDCFIRAQAFGDLDGDGVYSTYERAIEAKDTHFDAAAGLVETHAGE